MRKITSHLQSEIGLTLIELITVVTVTAILAAIAIPQYSSYQEGGFDARAQVILRSVAIAEEAYMVDHSVYKSCDQTNCHLVLSNIDPIEKGITLQITATETGFTGTATHEFGSSAVFSWD